MTARIVHVIDDDEALRDSIRMFLVNEGLEVKTYASADAFLANLGSASVGCVVTDVRMPGKSGMDLLVEIARLGLALPVIVITGHADVPLAVRAMKTGAVDLLEKPFKGEALIDAVQRALAVGRELALERREPAGGAGASCDAHCARDGGAGAPGARTAQQDHRLRDGNKPEDSRGPSRQRDEEDPGGEPVRIGPDVPRHRKALSRGRGGRVGLLRCRMSLSTVVSDKSCDAFAGVGERYASG